LRAVTKVLQIKEQSPITDLKKWSLPILPILLAQKLVVIANIFGKKGAKISRNWST
jgi:hypothetical protein